MSAEKPYEPTQKEMQKAEGMVTIEQAELLEERNSAEEEIKKRLNEYLLSIKKGIDNARKHGELQRRFGTEGPYCAIGKYENPFDGYEEYEHLNEGVLKKWKRFLSPEAYQYVTNTIGNDDAQIFYIGKAFQGPTSSSGRGEYSYWHGFPDCWIETGTPDTQDYGDGEVYDRWSILIAKKMTTREKEDHLNFLEKYYESDEFREDYTERLRVQFLENAAVDFLRSNQGGRDAILKEIFHPGEANEDDKNAAMGARFYEIYSAPLDRASYPTDETKFVRVKHRKIEEVMAGEHGYVDQKDKKPPFFRVQEIDLREVDGYTALGLLLGRRDAVSYLTHRQARILEDRLVQLAELKDPGFKYEIHDNDRSGEVQYARYGKTKDGKVWVDSPFS